MMMTRSAGSTASMEQRWITITEQRCEIARKDVERNDKGITIR